MFKIYKGGQGKSARLAAAFCLGALNIHGCYSLFNAINVGSWSEVVLTDMPGLEMALNPPLLLTLIIFAAVSFCIFYVCNWHKTADFLIETELELRKVSWPNKNELVGSSFIVIMVVTVFSLVVLGMDFVIAVVLRFFYGRA